LIKEKSNAARDCTTTNSWKLTLKEYPVSNFIYAENSNDNVGIVLLDNRQNKLARDSELKK
jgi:hypothetical protein